MNLRKFQATHFFTGTEMLDGNAVLVTNAEGVVEAIVPEDEAGDNVQPFNGVLSPGFINCHCHLELSHMLGLIPEHTGLVDFVFKVVTQRHFPEEEILAAIKNAEDQMLANGIVAVGDICNNTLTLPQKRLQRLAYYNFIETSGWLPAIAEARFERSFGNYRQYQEQVPGQALSLSPHAPYSVSESLWQHIQPFFHDKTVTIHNQETAFEDELFEKGTGGFSRMYALMQLDTSFFEPTGKSSLQSYYSRLAAAKKVLLVHNTFTKEADIVFAQKNAAENQQQLFFCLCANANLYIENSMPPVQLFRQNNLTLVLGTDSLASNRSLSILDEMRSIHRHFPAVPLPELLQWATLNGARALQMDNTLGSFSPGKKPGILLLENLSGNQQFTDAVTVKRLV